MKYENAKARDKARTLAKRAARASKARRVAAPFTIRDAETGAPVRVHVARCGALYIRGSV